jgi:CubicO group peptidase (beta-lactamase class C family)
MKKLRYPPKMVFVILISALALNFTFGCNSSSNSNAAAIPAANSCIVEKEYQWPLNSREYWPTENWKFASMEDHDIDPQKMYLAVINAASMGADAILVIKDGYIVFEKYYVGDQNTSSELWSATKSFSSTLIGIAITMGYINNVNQLMREFMPEHDFGNISIYHVLTQSTGLNWLEAGSSWLQ